MSFPFVDTNRIDIPIIRIIDQYACSRVNTQRKMLKAGDIDLDLVFLNTISKQIYDIFIEHFPEVGINKVGNKYQVSPDSQETFAAHILNICCLFFDYLYDKELWLLDFPPNSSVGPWVVKQGDYLQDLGVTYSRKGGDCEDFSYLVARLLHHFGITAGLLFMWPEPYSNEGHAIPWFQITNNLYLADRTIIPNFFKLSNAKPWFIIKLPLPETGETKIKMRIGFEPGNESDFCHPVEIPIRGFNLTMNDPVIVFSVNQHFVIRNDRFVFYEFMSDEDVDLINHAILDASQHDSRFKTVHLDKDRCIKPVELITENVVEESYLWSPTLSAILSMQSIHSYQGSTIQNVTLNKLYDEYNEIMNFMNLDRNPAVILASGAALLLLILLLIPKRSE